MFHLRIQQIDSSCVFDLSWGMGQRLSKTLPWSADLERLYQDWQRAYLSFYRALHTSGSVAPEAADGLRGRVISAGTVTPARTDWHAKLVEAETRLLYEFHRWLRQAELFDLYAAIATVSKALDAPVIDINLTCTPNDLARLPWEAWELGAAFATHRKIRIARVPLNIRQDAIAPSRQRRLRPRILVILGSDPHHNFAEDWQLLTRSLRHVVDIPAPVSWVVGTPIEQLKQEIRQAIADPQGWDGLVFAGHSNETEMTGGELGIAPGVSIRIQELAPALAIAKQRGLQFALFNSCSGLSVAEALIDLGLSQVAIMREPIHTRVAQEFLLQFLQALAAQHDVHDAILAACHHLKTEANLTYPSAYLIPSLFSYPGVERWRLPPPVWQRWRQQLRPTWVEAIGLVALVALSWQLPVQDALLARRLWLQAQYRQWTAQLPEQSPALLLVQIDDQSLTKSEIRSQLIDRRYLAKLIDHTVSMGADVIAVDYLLDRPLAAEDPTLAQSIEQAIATHNTLFILAGTRDDDGTWLKPQPTIAKPGTTWQGDLRLLSQGDYLRLLSSAAEMQAEPERLLPLGYLIALADTLRSTPAPGISPSSSQNSSPSSASPTAPTARPEPANLPTTDPQQLVPYLVSPRLWVQPITTFSYRLKQRWFRPIVDFSIPPQQIYQRIPAWEFLAQDPALLRQRYPQSMVMIAPGSYGEAGINTANEDNFPLPLAVDYWRQQQTPPDPRPSMPGSEIHAYTYDAYRQQRLVLPIPDLWLMGVAVIAGKAIAILLASSRPRRSPWRWGLLALPLGYGVLSLQLYITAELLLPWLLPSAVVVLYVLPPLLHRNSHELR
ncbi:MAG TPA: CHASE2 domain-containing protein [Chroococcidiopsis sp.]